VVVEPNLGDDSRSLEDHATTENTEITEITERRTRRNPKEGNMLNVRQLPQGIKRFRI